MLLCLLVIPATVLAEDGALPPEQVQVLGRATSLYLDVQFSTWMPRGHTLADVAPVIRNRLLAAGFTVVRDKTEPHDLVFKVSYREERGKEFRFNYYGTNISGDFVLGHPALGTVLSLTLTSSSSDPPTGTAPYLDALYQFDTNPYYFLIGDLVRARVSTGGDLRAGLIAGMSRLSGQEVSFSDPARTTQTMLPSEALYAPIVLANAAKELARLDERRAIPVLTGLLSHADTRVRASALEALGSLGAKEARPAIEQVARLDKDRSVREAAAATLAALDRRAPSSR
jgi:hypothetical protein